VSPSVLVVDDEPGIREIAGAYLRSDGFEVREAATGQRALDAALTQMPDLVVLDLMLPDITGEEVCVRLRRVSTVPVLMLTAKSAEADRLRGLALGADDYLVKPFSPRELVARVRAILRRAGSRDVPKQDLVLIDDGRLQVDLARWVARLDDQELPLTATELRILAALARSPGRVHTRKELMESALPSARDRDERTIDVHMRNLRRKLERVRAGASGYVATAYGVGYRLDEEGGSPA
jgi:two-component system response regulator AdeR